MGNDPRPVDHHTPGDRWEFNTEVATVFDDMLERSIPGYPTMRRIVTDLAVHHATPNKWIVDLGCSRGGSLAPIIDRLGHRNRYLGVEQSPPMREAAQQRFADLITTRQASIQDIDLRYDYPDVPATVTLTVLAAQFIPTEHRPQLFARIRNHTTDAFILVEKTIAPPAEPPTPNPANPATTSKPGGSPKKHGSTPPATTGATRHSSNTSTLS